MLMLLLLLLLLLLLNGTIFLISQPKGFQHVRRTEERILQHLVRWSDEQYLVRRLDRTRETSPNVSNAKFK